MRAIRVLSTIITLFVILGLAFFFLAWKSEIAPQAVAERQPFDPGLVAHGASLAAVGNCIACHTVPGKEAFSGGLKLPTPFGTIYSTNITPDEETGIGLWSEAAFQRAMRQGVDREGEHLYPAFPYDHFTHVTDDDNKALYAYLMTRTPVKATAPKNELPFPLDVRPILAGWKLLFFDAGAFTPGPQQSDEWNRGAYLAEGLGHCGACHTPRNSLGAEDKTKHFAGGEAEGWRAYAINGDSSAPVPWDKDAIAFYLRHGYHELHGVSRGPMAEVTGNLAGLPDSDIDAIATYVASGMGEPSADRAAKGEELKKQFGSEADGMFTAAVDAKPSGDLASHPGAAIYSAACASCHESGKKPPFGGMNFHLSTAINAPNPQNIINVTLFGLPPADGQASAVMPAFGGALNDQQVTDLLGYLRQRFAGGKPSWPDLPQQVSRTRSGDYFVAVRPSEGIERAPANVGAKAAQ